MDKFCVWDLWAMNSEGVGGEWVSGCLCVCVSGTVLLSWASQFECIFKHDGYTRC